MRILNPRIPKEKKAEIISAYLTGDNSYEELSDYYKVEASTIRTWVSRYRKRTHRGTGVMSDWAFTQQETTLAPGTTLFLDTEQSDDLTMLALHYAGHSHSMVAGGLEEMS